MAFQYSAEIQILVSISTFYDFYDNFRVAWINSLINFLVVTHNL